MHPEEYQEEPGSCSICGMDLVQKGADVKKKHNYTPLIVAFTYIGIVAALLTIGDIQSGSFNIAETARYIMAGFFLVFSLFKFMDLKGFVDGYTTYDLLASRLRAYGYIYPGIELGLGIAMVVGFHPEWLLWFSIALMTFSGIGVLRKIAKKESVTCACLGTVLDVPLTSVTVIEDFGMVALALVMLFLG